MLKVKKYDWSKFKLKIFINKTVPKVFKAWADKSEVSKWFSKKLLSYSDERTYIF